MTDAGRSKSSNDMVGNGANTRNLTSLISLIMAIILFRQTAEGMDIGMNEADSNHQVVTESFKIFV